MRLFFAQLLEMAYMALTHPEELAMYLQRVDSGNRQIAFLFGLISIGNATALYHMRQSYDKGFIVFIPFAALLFFVLMSIWSFLAGSGIDALIRFAHPEKSVRSRNTIRMAALSLLPFVFVLPVAVPARIFSFQGLFLFVMTALLLVWHFVTLYRSIRYHYELEKKEALRACFFMVALLLIFPIVFFSFTMLEIVALAGG